MLSAVKFKKDWLVVLNGNHISSAPTKEKAQANAEQVLADAYEYIGRASVVRVANDGTILVFRSLSAENAQYEFHRDGKPASGCCMGRMTNGWDTFRTLEAYADYVVSQYNGVV